MNTIPYTWACMACTHVNPAEAARCSRCGCPAAATALQVETTRRNWRLRQGLPLPAPVDPVALLRELPLLWIAAALLGLGGAVFLIAGTGAGGTAFGGLLLALAALAASSNRIRPAAVAAGGTPSSVAVQPAPAI